MIYHYLLTIAANGHFGTYYVTKTYCKSRMRKAAIWNTSREKEKCWNNWKKICTFAKL